ncbi:MAG: 3-dehydroquinate synthase [Clostridia bacterium]|nr:3-dehydroquinate synthase [Clostridia bacterium]
MKKVTVNASRVYDIIIDKGILDRAGELCATVKKPCRAAILTDSNVAPLYLARLEKSLSGAGYETVSYTIPAGESSKSAENYLAFLSFLAQNKITRSDCIFALGGGVVGDLCGFCAATYLRGVEFIQIPTTLLAMVDSSVGGKTAIDIPEGKNLVGAFYQPSLVICDYDTLSTLPDDIFTDGCAEVIKYGLINDKELFCKLKNPIMPQIEDIIENCVRNKRDVVDADERDTGVRQLLNLGHTAAHSIEALSDFAISHGSAVAMGMAIILRAAAALGHISKEDCDEAIGRISSYGLPTDCPYSARELADVALNDKKRQGGSITLIMPFGIGDSRLYKVSVDSLEEIFKAGL